MKKRIIIVFFLSASLAMLFSTLFVTYFEEERKVREAGDGLEWLVRFLANNSEDAAGFSEQLKRMDPDGPAFLVSDKTGKILAGATAKEFLPDSELIRLLNLGAGTVQFNSTGGRLVASIRPLKSGDFLIGVILLPISGGTTFWNEVLPPLFLIILVFALIAGWMSGFILHPLEDLTRSTTRIAGGEISSRIGNSGVRELRRISENFNELADRLETTIVDSLSNQNQLEAILGSMNSGVIAVDPNNKIIIFNPFARRVFGIYSEVIGKDIGDVIKNTDLEAMMTVNDSFAELDLKRNNTITVRYKTTELTMDKNRLGKVTVIQDITDLKKLEQMRSQFVANVSHELKTPLTSIKGFTETLREVEDRTTRNKFLDIIEAESERLRRLIEDILSLSSIENQGNALTSMIDAADITDNSLRMLGVQARKKNIDFSLIVKGQPYFIGDADMFRQLVINLVENAIKYTEENGRVKVRLEEEKEKIILSVQDTGIGIAEEHLPRLFERFYRVDKSRNRAMGGTGLGLAIVKHIVIAFGGTIDVDSKPGLGSTFTVSLPNAREKDYLSGPHIRSYKYNE